MRQSSSWTIQPPHKVHQHSSHTPTVAITTQILTCANESPVFQRSYRYKATFMSCLRYINLNFMSASQDQCLMIYQSSHNYAATHKELQINTAHRLKFLVSQSKMSSNSYKNNNIFFLFFFFFGNEQLHFPALHVGQGWCWQRAGPSGVFWGVTMMSMRCICALFLWRRWYHKD